MRYLYDRLQVLEGEQEFSPEERLKRMEKPLLFWYQQHARILPWRERPEPYRVWVSEIMLQQTRVEAVKPYFQRFIQEFPTVKALAEAEDDRLMKLWEGLGYYNRARNLKKAAGIACQQYGGNLPDSYEELKKLPGIGSYTAGAVASIAYGIPVPAVDGNVLRVISRVLASRKDILKPAVKREMEKLLEAVMPGDKAGEYNQALMEIGAVVCIPNGLPKCEECPMESLCLARKQGVISEIPVKTPKKARKIEEKTIFLLEINGKVALRRRQDKGLLASLYEFPSVEGYVTGEEGIKVLGIPMKLVDKMDRLPDGKHIFSHVEWHMKGIRVSLNTLPEWNGKEGFPIFVEQEKLETEYPLPNAFSVYRRTIGKKSSQYAV